MANKNRLLFLLKHLQQYSDEKHPLTTTELKQALRDNGYSATVITLRDDIETLIESGIDISVNKASGVATTYSYIDRNWSKPELQILIDAVSSSQFLTADKSQQMIENLVALSGPSDQGALKPMILVSENHKAQNERVLLNVQTIRNAIEANRKISFQYFNYTPEMEKVYRHEGEIYIVSPYATIWMDDRYYLVCYSDKRQKVVSFRIDRMNLVEVTEEDRVPEPEGFNPQDYSDKIFHMFDGTETMVTLRCRNDLIDQVIDRFGIKIRPENITDSTFDVTVPVSLSGTFFAWMFQFAGKMTVTAPEAAKEMYAEMMDAATGDLFTGALDPSEKYEWKL